jgi:molecular chaperone DnaK (HSP70)
LRPVFFANGHLEREDQQHLCRLTEAKLLELDPEQYTSDPEPENLSVENLQRLQKEAEKLVAENKLANVAELEYQKLLDDLLQRAANAALPAEATALTGYTKSWSETQRKPLLDAIHKRLNELNPPERAEAKEPPSLMVQIQNAKDLTELDCLEIEVSSRSVDIQPKLMGYVKRRRFELENQGSEVAS